jgi:hypothetical protein
MRWLVAIITLWWALLSFACSTVKFNPARPIEDGYTQSGEPLDRGDLLDKLSQFPESEGPARRAIAEKNWSLALGIPGGFAFGFEIGAALEGKAIWPLFGAGAALWGAGLTLGILSEGSLLEASRIFNTRLEKSSSTHFFVAPLVAAGIAGIRWDLP